MSDETTGADELQESNTDNHFDQDDIEDEETIIWSKQPHYASQISSIISGIFLIFVGGLGLLILAGVYIRLNYTSYALTDKALYIKSGWLSNSVKRVPLERIQNTEYRRSWVERKLGFGTVEISSAGGSGAQLVFKAVPEPKKVQEKINEISGKKKQNSRSKSSESSVELATELRETRKNLERITELLEQDAGVRHTEVSDKAEEDRIVGDESVEGVENNEETVNVSSRSESNSDDEISAEEFTFDDAETEHKSDR